MTTTTLDIHDLLVEAGLDADKAKPLAKEILSRTEAVEVLATKSDLAALRSGFDNFKVEIYRALMVQTGAQIAIIASLFALFG